MAYEKDASTILWSPKDPVQIGHGFSAAPRQGRRSRAGLVSKLAPGVGSHRRSNRPGRFVSRNNATGHALALTKNPIAETPIHRPQARRHPHVRGNDRPPGRCSCRCNRSRRTPGVNGLVLRNVAKNFLEQKQHIPRGSCSARLAVDANFHSELARVPDFVRRDQPWTVALEPSKLLPLAGPRRPRASIACRSLAEKSLKIV